MDPVTAAYLLYRGWKWLHGKGEEEKKSSDNDDDYDDLLDVFV